MTIKTEDRERLLKQAVIRRFALPVRGTAYSFACDRCDFHREWKTETGAVTGAATHLLQAHRVKLTIGRPA